MIQLDMFEVQLGAAILLQFRSPGGEVVRVLADAGVRASGYSPDHVHHKLSGAFEEFDDNHARLDLIIGTHYDADHLDGLVPIINDTNIAITEVWLPPVANDSERYGFDEPVAENHLLARQFYSNTNRQILGRYLRTKEWVCRYVRPLGDQDDQPVSEPELNDEILREENLDRARNIFLRYRNESLEAVVGNRSFDAIDAQSYSHADDNGFEPKDPAELSELIDWAGVNPRLWSSRYDSAHRDEIELIKDLTRRVYPTSLTNYNFAYIRKSAADSAITAISLAKVVEALYEKRPQTPIACHMVHDGIPMRFVWRSESRRFERGSRLTAQGPEILLLGPSESLVEKHRNRLPVAEYAWMARVAIFPIKYITPSNQLSYVARFKAEGQNVLVTGDAGCVDFRPGRGQPYYREILAALRRLHVVLVAHHAGNNAYFYDVLSAAKYGLQTSHSYLLVSHATDDSYRPSREFSDFVSELHDDDDRVKVLFTSRPRQDKVLDYLPMICPPVGGNAATDNMGPTVGDVRLVFVRRHWTVKKHAVDMGTRQKSSFRGRRRAAKRSSK
jgi:hypothetical protein